MKSLGSNAGEEEGSDDDDGDEDDEIDDNDAFIKKRPVRRQPTVPNLVDAQLFGLPQLACCLIKRLFLNHRSMYRKWRGKYAFMPTEKGFSMGSLAEDSHACFSLPVQNAVAKTDMHNTPTLYPSTLAACAANLNLDRNKSNKKRLFFLRGKSSPNPDALTQVQLITPIQPQQ